jgi:hypothetical protein
MAFEYGYLPLHVGGMNVNMPRIAVNMPALPYTHAEGRLVVGKHPRDDKLPWGQDYHKITI